jgi:uncharacterized protein
MHQPEIQESAMDIEKLKAARKTSDEPVEKELLISVDSHVHFTDDWVKARLSKRLHPLWDEAQKKERVAATELLGGGKQLPMEDFVELEAAQDPGHFEPNAKLAAMDRDSVLAEVIFPEVGGAKYCTPTYMGSDWQEALKGYNQSMVDFASVNPDRLLSAYQIALYDIPFAVSEVHRLAREGARCVQVPCYPSEVGLPDVHDSRYDPLKGIFTSIPPISMSESIAFWILTGTLERFPKLKVLLIEPGLGWLPYYLGLLDKRMHMHYKFPGVKKLPSEYFKTQIGASFMYEPDGLRFACDVLGPECLYWSTDFPHPATCWPNSQQQVKSQFTEAGLSEANRRKIVYDNSRKLFGFGLPAAA